MRRAAHLLLLLVVACQSRTALRPVSAPPGWSYPLDARPAARAPHGMVVSEAAAATQVGVAVLAEGGNAVDAAVATALALAVVYPEAGNLGGGGFALVRTSAGEVTALDFREAAPAAATHNMYLDETGKPTRDSRVGARASGIPGTVAGLYELHKRHGSKPWAMLVAPAVKLAEEGFLIDAHIVATIGDEQKRLATNPAAAAVLLPGGQPLAEGTRLRQPELAATLRRIAERGPRGFYEGETADLLVAEMEKSGGLITRADLKSYQAIWREPLAFQYRGYRLWSMPPPSSGGITLALIAGILDGYDLRALGWGSGQHLHLLTEAMRRAFADRNEYLGDPGFTHIPPRLLDPGYAAARRATIDPQRATPSTNVAPGLADHDHTTHMSVVDPQGNAVALTTTLNELYGSAVLVPGAGFFLNDEMDDFAAKPGTPNMFGLVQGEANAIAPGKRPLSAMSPTIVVDRDGKLFMLAGGRGGPRIITATFQVLSNVIDFGMDAAAAVSAPRIHHQHLPDEILFEYGGLSDEQQHSLTARGHKLKQREQGRAIAASPVIVRDGKEWTGAPDPRRGGLAAGL